MESLMEILKYTIPAVIVFATVYFLFRNFLNQQYQMEALKYRQTLGKDIIPLKLQAYERLMMLCERISLDNLTFRLLHADMGSTELRNAMLIAIQQEYEHNITQQVYVSENLWKIIQLAKEQMQEHISSAEGKTTAELIHNIRVSIAEVKANPVAFAKSAVRNEAELLM
ncbi:MAG: hypothetical protein IPP49_10315 [Saprospiraceae bacterium]|nr:hypothetical protein [Saprospiraceae bacterium]